MDNYAEMKKMLKEILMKKMMENHPAEITAKLENDHISLHFSGRGVDILAIALEIAEKAAKRCDASCDDFCGMLKAGWNKDDSFAERKFEEIFGDLLDK